MEDFGKPAGPSTRIFGPILFAKQGPRIRAALEARRLRAGKKPSRHDVGFEARVLNRKQAANFLGYQTDGAAFDIYCRRLGVEPLSGRRGAYDRIAFEKAINRESGLTANDDYESINYDED